MSATSTPPPPPLFNDPALREHLMKMRAVDNVTNLGYVAFEYLCLAAVLGGTIAFCESRAAWGLAWGLAWGWNVPVVALAVVLVGGLQHRLAGLGHESAHYSLLRNKPLNDLAGDVLCMFPVLSTVHFYRVFHLAHHQYTNDPARDPDLVSLGGSKMVERFPMGRWAFIKAFYLRAFTEPLAVLAYQRDYVDINVLGRSENEYLRRVPGVGDPPRAWPRLGATLGLVYLLAVIAGQWAVTTAGRPELLLVEGAVGVLVAAGVAALLPDRAFFPSPFRQPYSPRVAGVLRLAYYTGFLVVLGLLRPATGGRSSTYFWLLWVLPMVTSFSFFMLLRDVYQHTNADDGRLTNSRVFFADPFTRWAVFVYGQDMHVPHHLFPAVPHYRLPELHQLLRDGHAEYAEKVVECHGTFANRGGHPTILDTLTTPRGG
jgi:fatty acid desaturase